MSANPYAPPTAHVEDIPFSAADDTGAPPYFAVSAFKLGVLAVCTFGIYELYWFYRNWQLVKAREQSNIKPFWRAFFAVFYCYGMFSHIRKHGESLGVKPSIAAGPLAAGWIISTLTYKLPDPYWLVTMLAIAFLLPVQAYVNRINAIAAPSHDRNSRLRGWNWVGIAVGGGLLVLAIVGTLLPQR